MTSAESANPLPSSVKPSDAELVRGANALSVTLYEIAHWIEESRFDLARPVLDANTLRLAAARLSVREGERGNGVLVPADELATLRAEVARLRVYDPANCFIEGPPPEGQHG